MSAQRTRRRSAVRGAGIRYRFCADNFDFWFQCLLGSQTNGGSEAGECFRAASLIRDGDPDSWTRVWIELGARTYTFDPVRITCPLLLMIGESEYEKAPVSRAQQYQCLERAQSQRKELIVGSYRDGAWGHALGTNLSLVGRSVFDRLDEVFAHSPVMAGGTPT